MKAKNYHDKKEIWIFLSHSNEDYDKVRRVRNMLEDEGLRPIMFFLKCLNDDDEIDDLIKREIDCRTRFILCDSENARNSKWVQRELEYIKNQEKNYEIIDLSKSDEEILFQLKEVGRKSRIYLSYTRKDLHLATKLYDRLSKYDYDVIIDINTIHPGKSYADQIYSGIEEAVKNGYVIALLTEDGIQSKWVMREIRIAREIAPNDSIINSRLIPIVIGNRVPEEIANLQYIQFSSETIDLHNKIVDSILMRLHSRGEIFTYYNNFKKGINTPTDEIESERLAKLYYNIAKA